MDIYSFENLSLLLKLTEYARDGVELYLEDEPATPEKIVDTISVHENGKDYMPDYIDNDDGDLFQIRYDRIIEE